MVEIIALRLERHGDSAIGIGESQPRLSWSFAHSTQSWMQKSYEIEVTWSTGVSETTAVESAQSQLVRWPWRPLASRERASIRVRVFGELDHGFSSWSQPVKIETGLLHSKDWACSLIEPSGDAIDIQPSRPIVFATQVKCTGHVRFGRLYVTAHGIYEASINGVQVGDHVLAPGWTSYHHRLLYQTFDVTQLVKNNGLNQIQIAVAEGWYGGRLGWGQGRTKIYGDSVGLVAKLILEYEDQAVEEWATDSSWNWTYGSHLSASLYDGEAYDFNAAISADTRWDRVRELPLPIQIQAPDGPPIRRIDELLVQKIITSPAGKKILDFGQNFAGRLRIRVSSRTQCTIYLSHAEVLENGELGRRPLRAARAVDTVIIPAGMTIEHEPSFTFHGFRYVQVEGWPGELSAAAFNAVVIHSDMERTGYFSCSSNLLNQLHQNVVWSMRSNFLSIPMDCPQRDERLGWTGDINMFAETGAFLYDTGGFLTSWLKDVAAEQAQHQGIVPLTVPNVVEGLEKEAHAIWGDVIVMLPWTLYQFYGDVAIIQRNFDSMVLWLDTIPRRQNGLWDYQSDWKLGDWLAPEAPPDDPGKAATDSILVADAFLVHTMALMSAISQTLQKKDEQCRYVTEHKRLHDAFMDEYMAPSGRLSSDTQTAYALALQFSLYTDDRQKRTAAERLEWLVRRISRFKIATGFAGTPYIGHSMSKVGLTSLFYRMLLERKCPSWLYPVSKGATTIWERWDSMLPSGEINPGEMTSFNHYALGSVADWMHKNILGLRSLEPGWSLFEIAPLPGGPLTWAEGSYKSVYGTCHIRWELRPTDGVDAPTEEGLQAFWMRVEIPPNTKAKIRLPGQGESKLIVGGGTYEFKSNLVRDSWPVRAIYARDVKHTDDLLSSNDAWSR